MSRSEVWMQGYNCQRPTCANPHPKGSVERAQWHEGWTYRFRGIPIDEENATVTSCTAAEIEKIRTDLQNGHEQAAKVGATQQFKLHPAFAEAMAPVEKKRRGRPPGSKNKVKVPTTTA